MPNPARVSSTGKANNDYIVWLECHCRHSYAHKRESQMIFNCPNEANNINDFMFAYFIATHYAIKQSCFPPDVLIVYLKIVDKEKKRKSSGMIDFCSALETRGLGNV